MTDSPLVLAHRAIADALNALAAAMDSSATDDELLSVVTLCEGLARKTDHLSTVTIAALDPGGRQS
ncbi:hypothetical protein [Pseudonocardia sp. H11422]|uniref:hypothetical protein n=1 Tax=Pseudonocardia sp. H11422 TaxID=2835866 RepID=UPI001BDCC0FA|nr:hypothetical protein [Pseudonocardia sp. H11422]